MRTRQMRLETTTKYKVICEDASGKRVQVYEDSESIFEAESLLNKAKNEIQEGFDIFLLEFETVCREIRYQ